MSDDNVIPLFGPQTEHADGVFLYELERQIRRVMKHSEDLQKLFDNRSSSNDSFVENVIESIDDIVDHASRASQIIYPTQDRNGSFKRAERLRQKLGLPDNAEGSLEFRKLRHHLQHYDERLDQWAKATINGNIAHSIISGRDPICGPMSIMRHFIPDEGVYIFAGEEFNILSAIVFCRNLLERLQSSRSARST